jgi:succinoglycan biosynthesis protein ExoM
MTAIAICICSYNRPEGLQRALRSIDGQVLSRIGEDDITVVVVDNSAEATGKPPCDAYLEAGRFAMRPVHEPRKGLVHARNRCLEAAAESGARYVAFLDDDEAADPLWLETLLARLAESGASAVVGPVFPLFERPPPAWLPVYRYVNRVAENAGFVLDGHTCNCLIDLAAAHAAGLAFDPRFNESGGEDTMYFQSLRAKGHAIAWAEDARVREFVPAHRMRPVWLFRRWYRTGIVEAQLLQGGSPSPMGRLANLARGIARLGAGGVRVGYNLIFHGWRSPDRLVASTYTACRGAGYVSGALGGSYGEYSRPDYR